MQLRSSGLLVQDIEHNLFELILKDIEEQVRQMSLSSAARAALTYSSSLRTVLAASVVALAGLTLGCGASTPFTGAGPNHNAYVTLPAVGSVLQLDINGATGVITLGAQTPTTEDTSPTGMALSPSRNLLYTVNPAQDSISVFSVGSDGSLNLTADPTPVDIGADQAVVDPSGKYLLVSNSVLNGSVSVFSIAANTGALSELPGSPFPANAYPTNLVFTHNGNFVFVTNPSEGSITAFSFAGGVLTQVPGSPFASLVGGGGGAAAMIVDGSDSYLYVANPTAFNPLLASTGNISGFNIDSSTGALSMMGGSPFTSTYGNGPTAMTIDPSGRFVYAMTPGSSYSIWCFAITSSGNSNSGELVAVTNSPFSLAAGGLFAFFDPSGSYLYIGSEESKAIEGYHFNSSTGVLTAITGSPFSTGSAPGGMVFSD